MTKSNPPAEVISILARTVGGDGNLLLDVGPMPDGRIEPRQVEVLKQVGAWMDVNGESIYGTRGGPWKPTKAIASTRKGKTIYVHVLKWPDDVVKLPDIPAKIVSAEILGGGRAEFRQTESGIEITVDAALRDTNDTVVALKLDSDALKITAQNDLSATTPLPGYKLVWSDEFNGNMLDTNKWDFRTDSRMWSTQLPENVSVRDGKLILNVKKQDAERHALHRCRCDQQTGVQIRLLRGAFQSAAGCGLAHVVLDDEAHRQG